MATISSYLALPLTPADREIASWEKMTNAHTSRRVKEIKAEYAQFEKDDVMPLAKKRKRVTFGDTEVKEIERVTDLIPNDGRFCELWQCESDKSIACMEKKFEQFWETKGHRFRWTINERRWLQFCKIEDEVDEVDDLYGVCGDPWAASVFKGGEL